MSEKFVQETLKKDLTVGRMLGWEQRRKCVHQAPSSCTAVSSCLKAPTSLLPYYTWKGGPAFRHTLRAGNRYPCKQAFESLFIFFFNEDWQTIISHQLGPRTPAGGLFRVTWTSNRERGWLHLLLIKSELWVPWATAASWNVVTSQQPPRVCLHLDWEAEACAFHQNNE